MTNFRFYLFGIFPCLLPILLGGGISARAQANTEGPVPIIADIQVESGIDDGGQVQSFLEQVVPKGSAFIEAGDADRFGSPIGTLPRIKNALATLGYDSRIQKQFSPNGVLLRIALRAQDRVRQIFVAGNQPLFRGVRQEEIIRQLNIRPGERLPAEGKARLDFFAQEAEKVRTHLCSLGYWDASVRIESKSNGQIPATINLTVRVSLGVAYPLGDLKVSGNTKLPTDEIVDDFHHMNGWRFWLRPLPFRRLVLREDIARLVERYRKMGHPGVRVRDDFSPDRSLDRRAKVVNLGLEIKERRRLEVAFEGNTSRSSARLREDVTFFSRGAYDDVEAENSANAIMRGYREVGHMLVKVTWRRESAGPDTDRIVFSVNEGPKLKVKSVEFQGNQRLATDTLSEVVRTRPYPWFGFLGVGEGGYASLRQIELDAQSLVDYYISEGYLDAKVRADIAPNPSDWKPLAPTLDESQESRWQNAQALYVRFIIIEGPVVTISSISFQSHTGDTALPLSREFLLRVLRSQEGAPYHESLIKSDETRLARLFSDEGFRYARVEGKIERQGIHTRLTWQVDLGPKVTVGPIFIRGNFLTRPATIYQWAELQTGDVLTTHSAERAQRNLAMIQLFNNPNPITFVSVSRDDTVAPVLIEVEERHDHYGVLHFGGGASTEQAAPDDSFPVGVYASLGYEHRNLLGFGWTLSALGKYGSSLKTVTATATEPRLFRTLTRLELSGSYLRQATVRLGDLESGGGTLTLRRELASGFDASVRYSFRNTSRTEVLARSAGTDQNQTTVRIGTVVGSFGTDLEWRRLDNLLVPARGFKVSVGAEWALPAVSFGIGQDEFVKLSGRFFSVVPILRWLSVRQSLRYEHGFPLGGSDLLPKVERYYAGGDTTLRGFQLDHALTEWVTAEAVPGVLEIHARPAGGNLRILHNLDLQFPIAPPLYGSVFMDSGLVAYSLEGFSANDFRHGAGFSPLLIKLPIGDLSLSFAFPLDRKPGDERWRLHFNVGLMY